MQHGRRMAIAAMATLAAVAIGSVISTSPAVADEGAVAQTVTPTAVPDQPTPSAPPVTTGDTVAQASKGYKGGVKKGDDGAWIAYVEDPSGFVQVEVGRYKTKREARKAAKKAEDEWNDKGFMDNPACNDPIVVC